MTVRAENGEWIRCNYESSYLITPEYKYYPCLQGETIPNMPGVVNIIYGKEIKPKSYMYVLCS